MQEQNRQEAQWARIAHLRTSIMFGDIIFCDTQRQATLNLKQCSGLNLNTQDIMPVLTQVTSFKLTLSAFSSGELK